MGARERYPRLTDTIRAGAPKRESTGADGSRSKERQKERAR